MSNDTKREAKAGPGAILIGIIVWVGLNFLLGAVLAWASEGHLETIFETEIPFYNLWVLCSLALSSFGWRGTPRTK